MDSIGLYRIEIYITTSYKGRTISTYRKSTDIYIVVKVRKRDTHVLLSSTFMFETKWKSMGNTSRFSHNSCIVYNFFYYYYLLCWVVFQSVTQIASRRVHKCRRHVSSPSSVLSWLFLWKRIMKSIGFERREVVSPYYSVTCCCSEDVKLEVAEYGMKRV